MKLGRLVTIKKLHIVSEEFTVSTVSRGLTIMNRLMCEFFTAHILLHRAGHAGSSIKKI